MSEAHRILVPTDGSEHAAKALAFALSMAKRGLQIELHLLNVQPAVRGVAATLVSHADIEAYHREEAMKALEPAAKVAEEAGVKAHLHVGVGQAGDTILAFADRLQCEQIIMGTRGLGGFSGLLLGSAARDVAGGANVPVTLLR
jgi:nucleotide-binding universal stress UspA family protein